MAPEVRFQATKAFKVDRKIDFSIQANTSEMSINLHENTKLTVKTQ